METFIITFGSKAVGIKDGWVEVDAKDEEIARAWAARTYGGVWSAIYPDADFTQEAREFYPLGRLGSTRLNYEHFSHV